MKNYLIELTLPIKERILRMVCQADDEQDAYNLSQTLANLMPEEQAYFDKDDRITTVQWFGSAEEIKR